MSYKHLEVGMQVTVLTSIAMYYGTITHLPCHSADCLALDIIKSDGFHTVYIHAPYIVSVFRENT